MKKVEYIGFANSRTLGQADFLKMDVKVKEDELEFVKGEGVEVKNELAEALLSSTGFTQGEFVLFVDEDEEDSDDDEEGDLDEDDEDADSEDADADPKPKAKKPAKKVAGRAASQTATGSSQLSGLSSSPSQSEVGTH